MSGGRRVISAKQARQEAEQAARKKAFSDAKRGKGPAPAYRETQASGCLLALVLVPLALLRQWLR